MAIAKKQKDQECYSTFWKKLAFSWMFTKRSEVLYRLIASDKDQYPNVRVQIINSRAVFESTAHDLIHSGDICFFSTMDTVVLTYIATVDELQHEKNLDHAEIELTETKKFMHGRSLYYVKNLRTGELTYKTASELRSMPEFLSMSKKEISDVSYCAGYERALKMNETAKILDNNVKVMIEKVMISKDHVEMEVTDLKTQQAYHMDISELLFKRNILSKDDNFYLGRIASITEMNPFECIQQDQQL